jgi:hypothetical protein
MWFDRIERNEIAQCGENYVESLSARSGVGARPYRTNAAEFAGRKQFGLPLPSE